MLYEFIRISQRSVGAKFKDACKLLVELKDIVCYELST